MVVNQTITIWTEIKKALWNLTLSLLWYVLWLYWKYSDNCRTYSLLCCAFRCQESYAKTLNGTSSGIINKSLRQIFFHSCEFKLFFSFHITEFPTSCENSNRCLKACKKKNHPLSFWTITHTSTWLSSLIKTELWISSCLLSVWSFFNHAELQPEISFHYNHNKLCFFVLYLLSVLWG